MIKKISIILFIIALISSFIFLKSKEKTYVVGFMYWSNPSILENQWDLVLTGTVSHVGKKEPFNELISLKDDYKRAGELVINSLIYQREENFSDGQYPKNGLPFTSDKLFISGGFRGLKNGEKILLYLTVYEGAYALADIKGTATSLGIKLESFNDPIVGASKKLAESNFNLNTLKEDEEVWRKYDEKTLVDRLEIFELMKNLATW